MTLPDEPPADQPDVTKPRLSRDVIVLGLIAFFVMLGFGVVIPVLPVYVRDFGVGYIEVGAVVSAFALMRLVSSPFVGRMIDWAGERTILTVGIGIVAASSALLGLAQSYPEALIWRGVGGIGSAMFTVSAMTLLIGSTPQAMRGRSVGFYQGGFLIGGMAGPALGGLLAGISLTAPFFFYAGTLVVAGLVGVVMLKPKRFEQTSADEEQAHVPFRMVLRDARFQAACLANFSVGWASMGVRSALIPILVVEVLREPAAWTGIAFAVAAVAQTVMLAPAGRFVDTVGRRPAMIGAFAVAGLTIFAIPLASNIWILIVILCVYGAAAAFMGTAPAAAVGDAAGSKSGNPVAVFSMMSDLGAIIGPLAAGLLVDLFSYQVAFGSATVLLVAASLFALRMPRSRRRARKVPA